MPPLTQTHGPLALEDAYRVQERGVALRLARGERVVGYKMGLTSAAKRAQMSLGEPIYGVLTDAMQLGTGPEGSANAVGAADAAGAAVPTSMLRVADGIHPKIEPEIYFVTARELRGAVTPADALAACSAVGPAMEILDSLEPVRRHIYTGSIGWLGWDGDADWQIAIRTVLATSEGLLFHAGGGVTADSEPTAEYEESLVKAEGLRLALSAVLGELTLRDRAESAR